MGLFNRNARRDEENKVSAIEDPAVREARTSGLLADRQGRMARKAEAIGATETAADCRRRQANMVEHLHDAANRENERRG